MNPTKTYLFFDSKSKKMKKPTQHTATNHSRSLSAKSDLAKNSARTKLAPPKQQCLPLTKKQKQIRQAIQYRYRKSKMRDFEIEYKGDRHREEKSRSRSSQMEEFREMKMLKVVNLKEYHEAIVRRKLEEKQRNSLRNKLRIRTDSSLIIKTEGSQKSMQKIKFLKCYLQPQLTPTKTNSKLKSGPGMKMGNKQDWKFISIQSKEKITQKDKQSKSKNKELKINSHRTVTVENQRTRMKTVESQWELVPKLKDLGKLSKKYRF